MNWKREHYCPDTACEGADGFDVNWYSDADTPSEPARDTCPKCGAEMIDSPPVELVPCGECDGEGVFDFTERRWTPHGVGFDTIRETCDACDGAGKVEA